MGQDEMRVSKKNKQLLEDFITEHKNWRWRTMATRLNDNYDKYKPIIGIFLTEHAPSFYGLNKEGLKTVEEIVSDWQYEQCDASDVDLY